jgi:hypothetical protein
MKNKLRSDNIPALSLVFSIATLRTCGSTLRKASAHQLLFAMKTVVTLFSATKIFKTVSIPNCP